MTSSLHTGFLLSAIAALMSVLVFCSPMSAHAAARHSLPLANPATITLSSELPSQVTTMSFTLAAPAKVRSYVVRDGSFVRTLRSATMRRGRYSVTWDGTGGTGAVVTAGDYTVLTTIRRPRGRATVLRTVVSVPQQQLPASSTEVLVWPVDGIVSSPFGPRGTSHHDGIDIPAPEGAPIAAATAGRVVSAGSMRGYGLTVVIESDTTRMRTLYAHQSRLAVAEDQIVAAGEVIGYVGHTGVSSGDHLHFELRGVDNVAVDPLPSLPHRDR